MAHVYIDNNYALPPSESYFNLKGGMPYMANNTNNFTANLKVILDKTSVNTVQKELSKKDFTVNTKVNLDAESSLRSIKNVMKNFVTTLQQSVTELKEMDNYLTKISKANITLPTSELAKIGEKSTKDTSSKSGLNGLLSVVNEITQKAGALAMNDVAKGLLSGAKKNFGRSKMFDLVLKFAEYHKCSFGY